MGRQTCKFGRDCLRSRAFQNDTRAYTRWGAYLPINVGDDRIHHTEDWRWFRGVAEYIVTILEAAAAPATLSSIPTEADDLSSFPIQPQSTYTACDNGKAVASGSIGALGVGSPANSQNSTRLSS